MLPRSGCLKPTMARMVMGSDPGTHWCGVKDAFSTGPKNKVSITAERHSRMLLAGIQKGKLDARLRGQDG